MIHRMEDLFKDLFIKFQTQDYHAVEEYELIRRIKLSEILSNDEKKVFIEKQANEGNIFAIEEVAEWYKNGSFYELSEDEYYRTLENLYLHHFPSLLKRLFDYRFSDAYGADIVGDGWEPSIEYYPFNENNEFYDALYYSSSYGKAAYELALRDLSYSDEKHLSEAIKKLEIAGFCGLHTRNLIDETQNRLKKGKDTSTIFNNPENLSKYIYSDCSIALNSQKEAFDKLVKLIQEEFSSRGWQNLSDTAKTYLNTAFFTYLQLFQINKEGEKNIDFGIVISPLMKALEFELQERFYKAYLRYITSHYTDVNDYFLDNELLTDYQKKNKEYLIKRKKDDYIFRDPENADSHFFTLGKLSLILGYKQKLKYNQEERIIDKSAMKYLLMHLNFSEQRINDWIVQLITDVSEITHLRNRASHGGEILKIEDANFAFYQIVHVKKILNYLVENWI